jgi:hypothetical protein
MKIITHTILYSATLLLVLPFLLSAQGTTGLKEPVGPGANKAFVPCGGLNDDGTAQPDCEVSHLVGEGGIVQRGLNWIFMFAGFIAAIMFMYAGFLLITAAGDSGQITRAKGVFKNVVIGFVIMLVAVVAIRELLQYIGADEFFKKIIQ